MRPKLVVVAILGLTLPIALFFMKASYGGLNPDDTKSAVGVPDTAASSGTAIDDFLKNQSEDHSMQWFYSDTQDELKGVALVIHGLNLRPDRMQPIISKLAESGMDVLSLSLRGHGENYSHSQNTDADQARLEAFKTVSYQVWMNEAYLAYLQLRTRGAERGVPLFLTAFSIGGLIGLDLFASNADVMFDKLILFAPAIRLHPIIYLERIFSPFPRLVIPSMAPKTYLANTKGTPIAAYNALFDSLEQFNKNAGRKLNVPTLVFIDKQDEFIPLGKLKKLVAEKKWTQWQFYLVEKDQTAADERFYHHIIDASSTGNAVWREMMAAAVAHLNDEK
ncbi:MAG: alpha/beta hydrolase [bacterium]|nr:alpha/beta hydrolase [bacterium]